MLSCLHLRVSHWAFESLVMGLRICAAVADRWMVLRTEAEMASLGAVVTALGSDWSAEVVWRGFFYVLARRAG